ncbi:hypothetical protein XELAEV_18043508mg [Xenopus laevis]|uniref:Uncharacterized protein n=1 Tax=Xenopus laevis TaxID=8355 RepID=A0A974BX47_XENLA|nr:hypothetical protein XELAEV_18043508mg [Xenopus laevis]
MIYHTHTCIYTHTRVLPAIHRYVCVVCDTPLWVLILFALISDAPGCRLQISVAFHSKIRYCVTSQRPLPSGSSFTVSPCTTEVPAQYLSARKCGIFLFPLPGTNRQMWHLGGSHKA